MMHLPLRGGKFFENPKYLWRKASFLERVGFAVHNKQVCLSYGLACEISARRDSIIWVD
jgi:hypothetical protein